MHDTKLLRIIADIYVRTSSSIPKITGGDSYVVGGAAAPPTLASATPTLWLATPILMDFGAFRFQNDHVDPELLYHDIIFLSFPTLKRLIFTTQALKSSSNITVCPTNFAKEAPPMPKMVTRGLHGADFQPLFQPTP